MTKDHKQVRAVVGIAKTAMGAVGGLLVAICRGDFGGEVSMGKVLTILAGVFFTRLAIDIGELIGRVRERLDF